MIGGALGEDNSGQIGQLQKEQIDEYNPGSALSNAANQVQGAGMEGRQAQMNALGRLGTLANANGLDPQAIAMQQQAMAKANQAATGQRQSALQDAQMRGNYGGGLAQQAALQGAQSGANANAMAATQAASDARGRALQALGNYANLGGGLRGQDIGQAQLGFGNQGTLAAGRNQGRQGLQNFYTNRQNAAQQKAQGYGGFVGGIGDALLGGI
jgi:hypothetical protein